MVKTEQTFQISQQTIQDQISALLYALSIVNDDDEIISVAFGDITVTDSPKKTIPVTVTLRKEIN